MHLVGSGIELGKTGIDSVVEEGAHQSVETPIPSLQLRPVCHLFAFEKVLL